MRKQNIQLQNEDGSHRQWLCQGEIDRLMERGECFRITRRKDPSPKYRMKPYPQASESHESASSITPADTRAVAGLQKVDEVWIERLIGFNLVPEGTLVPEHGYL
jgi:hypothetical protein